MGFGGAPQLSLDLLIGIGLLAKVLSSTFLVDITEYMSLFESGISGSLTEETLLLESFLLRL